MRHIVRALIFLLAIAIFALVLLVFWFIFASFAYGYGFSETISHMLYTMDSWWQALVEFFAGLFKPPA